MTTTPNHRSESESNVPLRAFRVPQNISEDIAFALEAGDGDVLAAVVKRHGIDIDAFTSADVPPDERDAQFRGMPEILCVSLTFGGDTPELLFALPASLSLVDGVELAFRIAGSGKAYSDHSAVTVELHDGRELMLFGGWDFSADKSDAFIFGHRFDLPMARPVSTAIH